MKGSPRNPMPGWRHLSARRTGPQWPCVASPALPARTPLRRRPARRAPSPAPADRRETECPAGATCPIRRRAGVDATHIPGDETPSAARRWERRVIDAPSGSAWDARLAICCNSLNSPATQRLDRISMIRSFNAEMLPIDMSGSRSRSARAGIRFNCGTFLRRLTRRTTSIHHFTICSDEMSLYRLICARSKLSVMTAPG